MVEQINTNKQEKHEIKQPKKEDTLVEKAGKRSQRIITRKKIINFVPQWWIGTGEILGLAGVLLVNFFLLLPFFGQKDVSNVFSAPLIPLLANLTSFYIPYDFGIRFWLLIFLLVFPISFYFLIREISNRRLVAFSAALVVSLPLGIFLPLRTKLALLTQDGGQVASLTLTMFACLFLLRFLRVGNFAMGIHSAIIITLVALTSPLGLFILFCFAIALAFSEMLLAQGRIKIARFLIVFILATGFCAFWYNPKFVFLIISTAQGALFRKTLTNLLPLTFFLAPMLGAFGFLLFEKRPQLQPLFLAVFFTIGFGLLSLGAGMELSSPSRFVPSFGIALSFLIGLTLSYIFNFIQKPGSLKQYKFISRHKRLAAATTLAVMFFLALVIIDISGSQFREQSSEPVLGVNIEKRTGIWEFREQAGGISKIIGNLITIVTLGLTIFLGLKFRKKNSINNVNVGSANI
ncbi:hypothetical protein ACFLZ1_05420 [Patescibacteria group bacterium]